ncbi:MAG TPA: acyl-CoA dehydrogenase family protein [Pseudomonadales bacterium]|jgi:alkylation response protein AidB-like acyl-CoA dehydrogenase|nr:acyl-CoA dehydrogenase [Gammaproteobacteria bacterium]MDP6025757.1 acyl-CoA dehydrogenase family protein [Pseudomonadales bacterium]MDP6314872.1 acyl-CoA dehydrogenase family protein [Pseudomonadales bacterium]MDP7313726.1 acyl-CoA dehydrogenase family protein [Pseudomonadales bacterium]MDP7577188.1 acyl-CoA dehydrogenase family protein [Pseudomonadales bacterium]|tara:strand:- start:756 stop:1925 length:1170 start_codon:yes stop_codon:yes gene_type:complete
MYFSEEPEHIGMLRESMRRFVERHLPEDKVRSWDKAGEAPISVFHELAKTGVCGLTIDEEYGGEGKDLVAAISVLEELGKRGGAAAGPFIHCAFYGGLNIGANGSEEQKRNLLPKLAKGELLMAYGLSEPDVGGDLASVQTRGSLSEDGKEVIINGTKRWCTGARFADYIICLLNSDPDGKKYQNLSFVLIPTNSTGITVYDLDHSGLRYARSTDVIFEDVHVPAENILGGPESWNKGWPMLAKEALDVEKLEITAIALANASAAVDDAWDYAQQRKQFGRVISGHQAIRHKLSVAKTKLQACRHMLYHAAWLADRGEPCSVEASMAKLFIADTGLEIVLACQQVMGAYGCSGDYDMERYVREATLMPIVGGSSDMQKNNIAARLGLAG